MDVILLSKRVGEDFFCKRIKNLTREVKRKNESKRLGQGVEETDCFPFEKCQNPPSMELKQIDHFLMVAQEGSISKAAEKLGITQPHLSRQIKALEEEWGWILFERNGRGVTLTPQGEVSHREMLKVQRVLENSLKIMHREYGKQALRIGYAPSFATEILQSALTAYRATHSKVSLSLYDMSASEMQHGIETGKLDLILGVEFPDELISWTPLYSLPHLLVCRNDHPFAQKERLCASELHQQHLLMFHRQEYPVYWEKITAYFQEKNVNAKVIGEFDGVESLLMALKAGLGIAILTPNHLQKNPDLTGVEIEGGMPEIQVSIGYANYKAPLPYLQDFIHLLMEKSALASPQ